MLLAYAWTLPPPDCFVASETPPLVHHRRLINTDQRTKLPQVWLSYTGDGGGELLAAAFQCQGRKQHREAHFVPQRCEICLRRKTSHGVLWQEPVMSLNTHKAVFKTLRRHRSGQGLAWSFRTYPITGLAHNNNTKSEKRNTEEIKTVLSASFQPAREAAECRRLTAGRMTTRPAVSSCQTKQRSVKCTSPFSLCKTRKEGKNQETNSVLTFVVH